MTKRVACIGDSLTWGFSLPDPLRQSYPALLQERLGAEYEVRNFGCNGASVRCDADLPYMETMVYGERTTEVTSQSAGFRETPSASSP